MFRKKGSGKAKPKAAKPTGKSTKKQTKVFEDQDIIEEMQREADNRTVVDDGNKFDKKDKIFHNDYNTGSVEMSHFADVKINQEYASTYLSDVYNAEDYVDHKALLKEVYDTFKKSQWKALPLTKKFSKELMPFIFNDIYGNLTGKGHSTVDIVICIAEFMDITYERMYEIAGLRVKEELIKELEIKYKRLSKKKINRLF